MLEEHQLAAIKALARLGSFREAADRLGTSPASFSRHIQQAEHRVGLTLFDRQRGGVRLTPAGKEFLILLEDFDGALGAFESGIARLQSNGGDRLRIGCGPLTTRTLISPLLSHLLKSSPEFRVSVSVDATKGPLEALRLGELDVALCDLTHTADLSDLDLHVIDRKPVAFYARPQHMVHQRGVLDLSDVLRLPLATPFLHAHWRASLARALGDDRDAWETVKALPVVESDDYALLIDLATGSDLVCGGMAETFAEHEALGLLRRLPIRQEMGWNICAARRKGTGFPALDVFWEALVAETFT